MEVTNAPLRLYHYLEAKWALDDLRRRRLKLSTIEDMNDPYDSRCASSSHWGTQFALETTIEQILRKYTALCFSRSRNNILMWSHYGEKHQGLCLGFDVPEKLARPVEYTSDVNIAPPMIVEKESDFAVKRAKIVVESLLGAKYIGWAYEEEVRVHFDRDEVDEETQKHYRQFNENLVLKEVIAGARFPFSKKVIEDALTGHSAQAQEAVAILKAHRLNERFEIEVTEDWVS